MLDHARDAELVDAERLKAQVVAHFERQTSRLWSRRVDHAQILYPTDAQARCGEIELELLPVEGVTTVEEMQADGTWLLVDAADYTLTNQGLGLLRRLRPTFTRAGRWSLRGVRVTYTGGYQDAPAPGDAPALMGVPVPPADIVEALYLQARYRWARQGETHLVVKSQSFEGGSGVLLDPGEHPEYTRALDAHRRLIP